MKEGRQKGGEKVEEGRGMAEKAQRKTRGKGGGSVREGKRIGSGKPHCT